MIRIVVLITLLIASLASCKSQKNPASSGKTASEVSSSKDTTSADVSVQRFIVSFYSTGSGTEGKQIEKLKIFIAEFEKQVGKKISFTTVPWGREGEIDYCFSLKELNDEQQKQFIGGTKDALQSAQRVHYSENAPCRK